MCVIKGGSVSWIGTFGKKMIESGLLHDELLENGEF